MAYQPQVNVDAKTRNGLRATYVEYDDNNWPAPWIFEIDGKKLAYSIGGFLRNHGQDKHDLDLIGAFDPISEIPLSTLKWWRQLVDLNPSDLAPRLDEKINAAQSE